MSEQTTAAAHAPRLGPEDIGEILRTFAESGWAGMRLDIGDVSIAVGKVYGYEGTRSLVADGEQGLCNTSTAVYDSFRAGALVDGTNLSPFCIRSTSPTSRFISTRTGTSFERPICENPRRSSTRRPADNAESMMVST